MIFNMKRTKRTKRTERTKNHNRRIAKNFSYSKNLHSYGSNQKGNGQRNCIQQQ